MPSVKEESPKDVCWRFKTQHIFNGHPLSFYRGLSTIHPSSSSRGLKEGHRVAERMDPYPVWIWCQKDPSNGQVLRINHQIQLSPWSKGILWRVLGADPFKDYARLLWNNHRMRKPCITLKGQLIITFNHLRPCCFVFWWAAVSREAWEWGPYESFGPDLWATVWKLLYVHCSSYRLRTTHGLFLTSSHPVDSLLKGCGYQAAIKGKADSSSVRFPFLSLLKDCNRVPSKLALCLSGQLRDQQPVTTFRREKRNPGF